MFTMTLLDIKKLILSMILLLLSIILHYFITNYNNIILETDKCPFCYGTNFCPDFNEITFTNLTFSEQLSNTINVKNVYTAHYKDTKVVLKKLGHNWELKNVDTHICESQYLDKCPPFSGFNKDFTSDIIKFLINDNNKDIVVNFKICSLSTIDQFMNSLFALNSHLNTSEMTANIWTTVLANAEPLLLQILNENDGWPVPKYLGACGRVIIEEYSGLTLNSISEHSWLDRADVALQLLQAAQDFTHKHPLFRFYLTDLSSDNIAVTLGNKIKFIDLENVIVAEKKSHFDDSRLHESQHFDCDNCYAFVPDEICSHGISDHNFYSVCKLLLSRKSPWPMMKNGLLHSPPDYVTEKYAELFKLIEICAESSETLNRFQAVKQLIASLQFIIKSE